MNWVKLIDKVVIVKDRSGRVYPIKPLYLVNPTTVKAQRLDYDGFPMYTEDYAIYDLEIVEVLD